MILGKQYTGPEVDIWSLGVILYALLGGHLPFRDPNTAEMYKKIATANYKIPPYFSEGSADLIKRMLVVDASKRATIEEIRRHPWTNEGYTDYPESFVPPRPIPKEDELDDNVLEKLASYGFDAEVARMQIRESGHGPAVSVYYLIKEHMERKGMMANASMGAGGRRLSTASSGTRSDMCLDAPAGALHPSNAAGHLEPVSSADGTKIASPLEQDPSSDHSEHSNHTQLSQKSTLTENSPRKQSTAAVEPRTEASEKQIPTETERKNIVEVDTNDNDAVGRSHGADERPGTTSKQHEREHVEQHEDPHHLHHPDAENGQRARRASAGRVRPLSRRGSLMSNVVLNSTNPIGSQNIMGADNKAAGVNRRNSKNGGSTTAKGHQQDSALATNSGANVKLPHLVVTTSQNQAASPSGADSVLGSAKHRRASIAVPTKWEPRRGSISMNTAENTYSHYDKSTVSGALTLPRAGAGGEPRGGRSGSVASQTSQEQAQAAASAGKRSGSTRFKFVDALTTAFGKLKNKNSSSQRLGGSSNVGPGAAGSPENSSPSVSQPSSPRKSSVDVQSESIGFSTGAISSTKYNPTDSKLSMIGQKPRSVLRPFFVADTTSTKPVHQIVTQLENVLRANSLQMSWTAPFKLHCVHPQTEFEIEICRIRDTDMHGLEFRRLKGSTWVYQGVLQKLMSEWRL
ncbi:hypothetical protein HK102_002103 [Quaeritorhiza haematococci]|nr:hypothetical protein HK102_002103 [Quaeritorhiza haematococci]